jgi:mannose-6-phosphate isomerase-like protein (cupin superfamily)
MTRRGFLDTALIATIFGALRESAGAQAGTASAGYALDTAGGDVVLVGSFRSPVRIKIDAKKTPGALLSMIAMDVAPTERIPIHLHEKEDELLIMRSGSGIAMLGDQRIPVSPGSMVYVPKGTWHGGENTGTTILEWIGIYSPPGFEGYFREIGAPPGGQRPQHSPEEMREIDRLYGIRYPGR